MTSMIKTNVFSILLLFRSPNGNHGGPVTVPVRTKHNLSMVHWCQPVFHTAAIKPGNVTSHWKKSVARITG